MPKKTSLSTINQTAIGNDNIQVVGSNNVITTITNFFAGHTEQQRAMRNRRAMLELVKNTWIKGVLERSLYNEVLIELGMEERPGAVNHPWDMQLKMPDKENRILPPGTSIMQVFDEMNGTVLILGEPGSGKTMVLLELARDCITRAELDDAQPIPVVFNLSSWSIPNQALADWLVNELITKYYVSKKLARSWIEHDELLLLLDGLDEVKIELRELCVQTINRFRDEHGSMHLVVCSRSADYEALITRLNLQNAVLLQPLTLWQIDEYFQRAGPEVASVHEALEYDATLLELVRQPLMLSITILAYLGVSSDEIRSVKTISINARREHVFNIYIKQMFERVARTKTDLYTPDQTKLWLGWLAKKMIDHGQSVFLIEHLQPDWLGANIKRLSYDVLALILTLLEIASLVLITGFMFGASQAWIVLLLVAGLYMFFVDKSTIGMIVPVEALRWSRRNLFKRPALPVIIGLIFYVIATSTGAWIEYRQFDAIVSNLLEGLPVFIIVWLFLGGLTEAEIEVKTSPNQGIRRSLLYSTISGILSLVFAATTLSTNPLILLASYLVISDWFGSYACSLHYILRFLLYRMGYMPLEYTRFLNYAVDRIFLRKIGGGYIFVHRLLMEHFAAMYQEEPK
ncbi:MAG TPA: NACHT domain-containing protein [Anaerolineales bacterium]|nr:NACHT domain-containing protein [Anaerolineales bacterium]